MLISVFLLPVWWRKLAGREFEKADWMPEPHSPSSLYRSELWRLGLAITRNLPSGVCDGAARALAGVYWALAPHPRGTVGLKTLPAPAREPAPASPESPGRTFPISSRVAAAFLLVDARRH